MISHDVCQQVTAFRIDRERHALLLELANPQLHCKVSKYLTSERLQKDILNGPTGFEVMESAQDTNARFRKQHHLPIFDTGKDWRFISAILHRMTCEIV